MYIFILRLRQIDIDDNKYIVSKDTTTHVLTRSKKNTIKVLIYNLNLSFVGMYLVRFFFFLNFGPPKRKRKIALDLFHKILFQYILSLKIYLGA